MPILHVRGLVKYFGRRKVVDGVDFEVEAGEVVGLIGPNGAGKTTTFRMTTGQISPNGGEVLFNGEDVTHLPMFRRARLGMGYLSQETSVFRKLTVEQNILAILEAVPALRSLGRAPTRRERWQRTDTMLEQFGLTHLRKSVAARLSGGEKRRLEIARCLVCEPLLILLDEPFTGIDPKTIGDIQQIVRDLRKQGISILVTDHHVDATLTITDRTYLIQHGKVQTHGTSQQIVNDPIAIREYLGDGFKDETFGAPPRAPAREPASSEVPVHRVLEHERIHRLVADLKSDPNAATELLRRGREAVPALIEALERRDVELRRRAFEVMQRILQGSVTFDPYAPEAFRRQQITDLRDTFERKAG